MRQSDSEARKGLIDDIRCGFDLPPETAAELAENMRRGGPMADILHWEYNIDRSRRPLHDTLAQELQAGLRELNAPNRWAELLPERLRPGIRYLYYVLRDGETYGKWFISNQ